MLKIEWNLGLGNYPNFILEETLDLLPREECEFQFKDGIFWHVQENGLVRFFSHDGSERNMGGFGGTSFDILYEGKLKNIRGPWSSRASYLNQFMPDDQQVAEVRLFNRAKYPTHIGILVPKLIEFWDVDAYMLRPLARKNNVRQEHGPVTASMAPNCILKPNNDRYDKADDYQVFAEPFNGA